MPTPTEIRQVEPVGANTIQPTFSDGHATGIYSWEYLVQLGLEPDSCWAGYLKQMEAAGANR
jgi:DUF971 family protein